MRKVQSIFVILFFSAAFVASDLCHCADPAFGLTMTGTHGHAAPSGPCGDAAPSSAPCPNHFFHAASDNLPSLVSEKVDLTAHSSFAGAVVSMIPTPAVATQNNRLIVRAAPAPAGRSLLALHVTLLL